MIIFANVLHLYSTFIQSALQFFSHSSINTHKHIDGSELPCRLQAEDGSSRDWTEFGPFLTQFTLILLCVDFYFQ